MHRQTCPLVLRAVLRKPLTLLFSFRINGRANLVPSGGQRCSKVPARFVGAQIHPPEAVDGADVLILSTLATASAYRIPAFLPKFLLRPLLPGTSQSSG